MRYFEHNDIIVPRQHLAEWTKWAIVVDLVDGDGTIHAFPRGGGFGLLINPIKVEEYDFIKVPQEKLENPGWASIQVYADWTGKKYRAWSTGENWNGWAIPYFEFTEAMKYAKHSQTKRGASPTIYDPARDAFVTQIEGYDEPQVEGATIINVRGRGEIKVYPLGNGWTWEFVKEKKAGLGILDPHSMFSSPQVQITSGAKAAFEESGEQPAKYLDRHFRGDFGDVDPGDAALNQEALTNNGRVMSIYTLSTGVRFWIITDDGHEITTILLPSEY